MNGSMTGGVRSRSAMIFFSPEVASRPWPRGDRFRDGARFYAMIEKDWMNWSSTGCLACAGRFWRYSSGASRSDDGGAGPP